MRLLSGVYAEQTEHARNDKWWSVFARHASAEAIRYPGRITLEALLGRLFENGTDCFALRARNDEGEVETNDY